MTAQPIIEVANSSKGVTSTLIQVLLRTNVRGMVQIRGYLSTSCTTEDTAMRRDWCVEQQNTTYISNLYQLVNAFKPATTTALSACVRAYACASGENCDTVTCTTWNSGYTTEKTDIAIESEAGLTPIAVSNLILTPGDRTISASWGTVNNPTAWAFAVKLLQGSTVLANGYVTQTSKKIDNLTNGTEYTFEVRVRSYDGYLGPLASLKATPSAPVPVCTQPSCTFSII